MIRVQCETCQATLRVRDAGFVGEVHACPRCGSMVLISRSADQTADKAAAGKATADPPAPNLPAAPTTLVLGDTMESFEEPTPPTEADPVEAPVETPIETPIDELAAAEPVAAWAPIVTTAVSLMATGVILAAWLVSGGSPEAEPRQPPDEPAVVSSTDRIDTQPTAAPEPVAEEPANRDDPGTTPSDARLADTLRAEPVFDRTPAPEPEAPEPAEPRLALVSPPSPAANVPAEPPPELDPLQFDPAEAVVILRKGPPAEDDQDTPTPVETPAADPIAADPTTSLDEQLAKAAKRAGVFFRLGPTDASQGPPTGSAETGLAQSIPSIAMHDIPLNAALRLSGQIAGVPITLDPLALERAGVSPTVRVDLMGDSITVADLLSATLGRLRLDYQVDGPHVVVTRKGAERRREITHDLADLAGDDPYGFAVTLSGLLDAPRAFELDPTGKLTLDAPLGLHYDLLVLCERLRLARGLPIESKYPRSLLAIEEPLRVLAALDRRTTFSFVEPTPLATVFDHWQRVLGRPVLVDWRSLGAAGMGPDTSVVCSVTNRDWRDVLGAVLGPIGLGWRPAFGDSLQITTLDELDRLRTVWFHPLSPDLANDPELARAALGRRASDSPGARPAFGVYDRASGCLIVRDSPTNQRLVGALVTSLSGAELE